MAKKQEAPMPQITGGRVVFSRSVQPAQYESKKAEVEIVFAVPEGAEVGDFLDKAAAMAQNKALELVGLIKGPKIAPAAATGSQEAVVTNTPRAGEPASHTAARTEQAGRTKATLEAEQEAKLAGGKAKVQMPNVSTGEARVDPAQPADDWETEAAPVTDAAMKDACSKRNQAIKAPQKIKALIATFVEFPKGCADIPQAQRQDFLTKLAALKAD